MEVFSKLANDYVRHGDLQKAVTFYHKALATLEEMDRDSQSFAEKYVEIGQAYKSAGRLAMARDYITRSLALYEMRDEQRLVRLTHQQLSKTLEKQNDLDDAENVYRESITIEAEVKDDGA